MANRLQPILEAKRAHVGARKAICPVSAMKLDAHGPARGFGRALTAQRDAGRIGLIAECKKASPSKGVIRAEFDIAAIAAAYAEGGATCLSVLTDEPYFQGRDRYLAEARAAAPTLPALRKDFIVDEYQIAESRALGADAILLIAAALEDAEMRAFEVEATALGMDVLVEVHDEAELERALALETPLIGINNRDLKTMVVDLATSERLAAQIPVPRVAIGESGISTHADLLRLMAGGVSTFLVGESLMREADVATATRRLMGGP